MRDLTDGQWMILTVEEQTEVTVLSWQTTQLEGYKSKLAAIERYNAYIRELSEKYNFDLPPSNE